MTTTLFQQLGGESKVRAIIRTLVDRMFDDILIGFFFRNTSREHLYELEYQHAAAFLGGPVAYRGRDLALVHKPLRIMGGQFARRMRLLEEILHAFAVPEAVVHAWLAHQRQQLGFIVADGAGTCAAISFPTSGT